MNAVIEQCTFRAPALRRARFELGQRSSFWVAAAVVMHTLWTSAAPAMSYPLYAAQWHLTPTVTTAIFAVYPAVVVLVLMVFGDLSERIGVRQTMLLGLAASMLGVALFAFADSVSWLFAGRLMMGVGVGLSAGPSAAAMVEYSRAGDAHKASSLTASAQALGFGMALLVAGALIEYAPLPMRLNFLVLLAVLAGLFVAVWLLPQPAAKAAHAPWRLKMPSIPKGLLGVFVSSAVAVMTAYSLGAVLFSLGAQIAHDLIGSPNALVNGATLAIFALASGLASHFTKGWSAALSVLIGATATVIGMLLLAVSAHYHALPVFVAAIGFIGIGYSQLFMGGLGLLTARIPSQFRAGTLSALFLAAYLTQGLVGQLLGIVATRLGLAMALDIGAVILASLAVTAILLVAFARRRTL